ncbi:MAG: hypothetical protein ILP17_04995 [Lachnospiraceae bacterium]|nr:hypothetical protein [Lachnospiraceae bacterium]MBP1585029.1 hypothetical protein [Lachnospiraceae bacterium]
MYINLRKLYLQLAIWSMIAVPAFTLTFVFIGTMVEYGTRDTIPLFILWTAIMIVLLVNYVKTLGNVGRLGSMDRVFRADPDGSVPVQEVAEYLHTTQDKLIHLISYGERKKILINLVYDAQGGRFILTDRYRPADPIKDRPFVGMDCPGCGASLKIRAATTGVCPYCDRQVTAPNIVVGR